MGTSNGHMKPITIENTCEELCRILDKYEWFYDAVIEGQNICVYVHSMTDEACNLIPDEMYGIQIKLGFAAYLMSREVFGLKPL